MESAMRGPRCARLFKHYLENIETEVAFEYSIRILEGGAYHWMRNYYNDVRLVEDYNDEIWGYDEDSKSLQGHIGYERPVDQPPTPWSEAGSEYKCR
jgi:hypothetical protein